MVVIVIESDYPIIFSSPLTECLPLCLSSCFHPSRVSVSSHPLMLLLLLFLSVLPAEVCVHRLPVRGSPAALGQLQPLSVSARLSPRQGPLLRLGQRGSGLRPH